MNKVTGVETPGQWDKPSEELPKVDSPAVTGFARQTSVQPQLLLTPSLAEDEVVATAKMINAVSLSM